MRLHPKSTVMIQEQEVMDMYPKLLRLKEVMKRTGLSRSTIYSLIAKGKFIPQVVITERCVGWVEDEVHDWLLKRIENSRSAKQMS
jgi:prophage regulatory protein